MGVCRKLAAAFAGLILTLVLPAAASAYTYTTCITEPADYTPTWHVIRNTANYYAAQGEVVIRQLHGCTGSSGNTILAQVWPANMQGPLDFVQIGYANVGTGTTMNWWAATDANMTSTVSQMSLSFFPVIGHTVRFTIARVNLGGINYWRLKVDDLSHAGWWGWRDLVQNDDHTELVWYGIEDHNEKSQFGGNSSTNTVRLRGLSYRLSNGGAWNYLEGTTNSAWANTKGVLKPGCWIESISTYSGPFSSIQTSLNGYTADNGLALAPIC